MTTTLYKLVNAPMVFAFTGTAAQTSFPDLIILRDGTVVSSPTVVLTEVATGFYKMTYTPTVTGTYYVRVAGSVVLCAEVVDKLPMTYWKNIEDEALGSWTWDKTAKTLVMLRQNVTQLATFELEETLTVASIERST